MHMKICDNLSLSITFIYNFYKIPSHLISSFTEVSLERIVCNNTFSINMNCRYILLNDTICIHVLKISKKLYNFTKYVLT